MPHLIESNYPFSAMPFNCSALLCTHLLILIVLSVLPFCISMHKTGDNSALSLSSLNVLAPCSFRVAAPQAAEGLPPSAAPHGFCSPVPHLCRSAAPSNPHPPGFPALASSAVAHSVSSKVKHSVLGVSGISSLFVSTE